MQLNPGDVFSSYTVERILGVGGMGAVYKARGSDGKSVAIKIMSPDGPKERFALECKTLISLKHPGIPAVFENGMEPCPYMVQEIIDGPTLEERLREPVSREQALAISFGMLEVLSVVHEQGFVHRDLKPDNLLLRGDQVCLIDFGLVRVLDSADRFTQTGEILGTPAYLSPEQIDPHLGPVSPSIDQFAAGTIVYQLLTGRLPTVPGSLPKVMRQIVLTPAPPMPEVPESIANVCLKALQKKPEDRWASVRDFSQALRNATT